MVCTSLGSTASGVAASVVVRDCAVHRVFDRVAIGRQSGFSVSIRCGCIAAVAVPGGVQ